MKSYAGIGSRETPKEVLDIMQRVAKYLAEKGYTLRSGGAQGADTAFEKGCDEVSGIKEIFLPWKKFEDNTSTLIITTDYSNEIYKICEKFHPNYAKLSEGAKKLIARDGYQVLGQDLNSPVDFVICYTKDGKGSGGTGQAIRIAEHDGIPVFDIGKHPIDKAAVELNKFIKQFK